MSYDLLDQASVHASHKQFVVEHQAFSVAHLSLALLKFVQLIYGLEVAILRGLRAREVLGPSSGVFVILFR